MPWKPRFDVKDGIYNVAVVGILACAIYYFAAFIYIVSFRIGYPFSLDWLEGDSFVQVHRILTGKPLYAQPSFEYVAVMYPPLYYYVSAVISHLIGFSFFPLRLVSFVSSLGCIATIYLICRREGTGLVPAITAGALFTATYQLSGAWFDVGRVDMLSVFLILMSVYLLRLQAFTAQIGAGFVFALACLTKQMHLITLLCLCIYMVVFERGKSLGFVLSSLASLTVAFLLLNQIYSGWFGFFVLKLASGSGEYLLITPSTLAQTAIDFWSSSIVLVLPVAALFIIAFVVIHLRERKEVKWFFFYLAFSIGMIGTSWGVVQLGGYKNDLVPAYAVIAILFGLSLQIVCYERDLGPSRKGILLAACALQFAILYYPVSSQIPTKEDLLAGQALVGEIRQQSGAVYIPFHPELSLMAGKPAFASWIALYGLEGNYGGGDMTETRRVKVEFTKAMSKHEFGMIILDKDLNWVWGHPEKYYSISPEPVFKDPNVFWPVTGWQVRPTIKMFPNQP